MTTTLRCATSSSFLEGGDKVKVTLRFRGREMAHQNLGRELLERVAKDTEEVGKVENFPRWKAGRWS